MNFPKIKTFVISKNNQDFNQFLSNNPSFNHSLNFYNINLEQNINSIQFQIDKPFFFIIHSHITINPSFNNYFSFYYQFLSSDSDWNSVSLLPILNNSNDYHIILPNPFIFKIKTETTLFSAFNSNHFKDFSSSLNYFLKPELEEKIIAFPYPAFSNNNHEQTIINQQTLNNQQIIQNNSIYIVFKGQLGNNLFQLFTAQNIAIQKNKFLTIIANKPRKDIFQLYFIQKKYPSNFKIILNEKNNIKNKKNYYKPIKLPKENNFVLKGYFQNIRNFNKNKLLHLSPLKGGFDYLFYNHNSNFNQYLENDKTIIGIHIRLGDYLKHQKTFYIYTLKTILKQINFLISKNNLQINNIKILFFTNDTKLLSKEIKYLENNNLFNFYYQFVELNDIFSLILFSKLEYLIIPNSTYSWFGAYMNNNLKCGLLANEWLKDGRTGNPGPPTKNIITRSFLSP